MVKKTAGKESGLVPHSAGVMLATRSSLSTKTMSMGCSEVRIYQVAPTLTQEAGAYTP